MNESTVNMNQEVNEPTLDIERKPTYEKTKNAWVTFPSKRKKIKLRKYVSDIAVRMQDFGCPNYAENRDSLIVAFNENNLKGLNDHYVITANKYVKSIDNGCRT